MTEEIGSEQDASCDWIKLTSGKEFSRVLYPNPVCFLSVSRVQENDGKEATLSSPPAPPPDTIEQRQAQKGTDRNVQVVSWLTAIDNYGGFVFSINRRRHTASILRENIDNTAVCRFVLSVPVKGMEDLVKDVGSASGYYGSKFPSDYDHVQQPSERNNEPMSKRQRKKQPRFPSGIPKLQAIPLGYKSDAMTESEAEHNPLFAIKGTVAHLACRVIRCLDHQPAVAATERTLPDETPQQQQQQQQNRDEHILVVAQVDEAFVHKRYWDTTKKLFRPDEGQSPFLTFFGSQTFGYACTDIAKQDDITDKD